jgi:outer membrane murein-binding lipoprotein Lpp
VRRLEEWTDARLNDLAVALEPVPLKVAALTEAVEHVEGIATTLQPLPAQVAVLSARLDRLADENAALREEIASTQRQLLQMAWGLATALLAAAGALITALV